MTLEILFRSFFSFVFFFLCAISSLFLTTPGLARILKVRFIMKASDFKKSQKKKLRSDVFLILGVIALCTTKVLCYDLPCITVSFLSNAQVLFSIDFVLPDLIKINYSTDDFGNIDFNKEPLTPKTAFVNFYLSQNQFLHKAIKQPIFSIDIITLLLKNKQIEHQTFYLKPLLKSEINCELTCFLQKYYVGFYCETKNVEYFGFFTKIYENYDKNVSRELLLRLNFDFDVNNKDFSTFQIILNEKINEIHALRLKVELDTSANLKKVDLRARTIISENVSVDSHFMLKNDASYGVGISIHISG